MQKLLDWDDISYLKVFGVADYVQYRWLNCKKLLDWDEIEYSGVFRVADNELTNLTIRNSKWRIQYGN